MLHPMPDMNILLIRRGDREIFMDAAICLGTLPKLPGVTFRQHVLDYGIVTNPHNELHPNWVEHPDTGRISKREMLDGLAEKRFDLVFVQPFYNRRPGRLRSKLRALAEEVLPHRLGRALRHSAARWLDHLPLDLLRHNRVVVIDGADRLLLTPIEHEILMTGAVYFKWELPYDRSKIFFPKKKDPATLAAVEQRLEYYPLGISDTHHARLSKFRSDEKVHDVFWAGRTANTHRAEAVRRLAEAASRLQLNVMIPEGRLTEADFFRTAARSRVILSPEGQGWECWRHLQAFALGSVPFMNLPTSDARTYHSWPREFFYENSFRDFESGLQRLCTDDGLRQRLLDHGTQAVANSLLWSSAMRRIFTQILPRHFPDIADQLENPAPWGMPPVSQERDV